MTNKPNLKEILPQLQSWCVVNNISVQSVYDACHGMTLQELVYYLLGVVTEVSDETIEWSELAQKLYELFTNIVNNNNVTETFVNVTKYGVPNDGVTDCTNAMNTLFSMPELHGSTFYFPKGVYNISSTVTLDTTDGTSYFFDSGAKIIATTSFDTLINIIGGNNLTRRVFIYGGDFDCNHLVNHGIDLNTNARNITLFNSTINSFLSHGLYEIATGAGRHLMMSHCKIMSNTANNYTTGIYLTQSDSYFDNLNIMAGCGINFNNTGGHKLTNIHTWVANDVEPALFNQSVGILNPGECIFSNLYLDTYFCGIRGGSKCTISNIIAYWYMSEVNDISNTEGVRVIECNATSINIRNFQMDNTNMPNAKGIVSPISTTSVNEYNWISEGRFNVSGCMQRNTPYPDLYNSNVTRRSWTFDLEGWINIGCLASINRTTEFKFTGINTQESIYLRVIDNVLTAVHAEGSTHQVEVGYGDILQDGAFTYIPIYVKLNNDARFALSVSSDSLFIYNSGASSDATGYTSLGSRVQTLTPDLNGYSGSVTVINNYDSYEFNGTITKTSSGTTTGFLTLPFYFNHGWCSSCNVLGGTVYSLFGSANGNTLNIIPALSENTISFTGVTTTTN